MNISLQLKRGGGRERGDINAVAPTLGTRGLILY